jgi:hypothetical protein
MDPRMDPRMVAAYAGMRKIAEAEKRRARLRKNGVRPILTRNELARTVKP